MVELRSVVCIPNETRRQQPTTWTAQDLSVGDTGVGPLQIQNWEHTVQFAWVSYSLWLSHLSIITYMFTESRLFLVITLGAFLINDHRGRLND
jgi:hypothetical protein